MIAQKHLTGKGEFLYDYKYDILTFKIKNRNYKHSFEFQNFVADVDNENFITGIRIFDASQVFGVDKFVLRDIAGGQFKSRIENNIVTIVFKFVSKVRNRLFPLLSKQENFTQQITQPAPVKIADSLVEAPIVA